MIKLKSLLQEDTEAIVYNKIVYEWQEAFSTFGIIHNLKNKQDIVVTSLDDNNGSSILVSNDPSIKEVLDAWPEYNLRLSPRLSYLNMPTHEDVFGYLEYNGIMKVGDRRGAHVAGRGWRIDEQVIVSFYAGPNKLKPWLSKLEVYFDLIYERSGDALFDFPGAEDQLFSYDDAFKHNLVYAESADMDSSTSDRLGSWRKEKAIADKDQSKTAIEREKEFVRNAMKIQHISPEIKKALIKLPMNKKAAIAKSAGYKSVAEFEHELKRGMDEGLSMSDYNSEDVPADVKPVYMLRPM